MWYGEQKLEGLWIIGFGHDTGIRNAKFLKEALRLQGALPIPALSTCFYFSLETFIADIRLPLGNLESIEKKKRNTISKFVNPLKDLDSTKNYKIFCRKYSDLLTVDITKVEYLNKKKDIDHADYVKLWEEHKKIISQKYLKEIKHPFLDKNLDFDRMINYNLMPEILSKFGMMSVVITLFDENHFTKNNLFAAYPYEIKKDQYGNLYEKRIPDAAEKFFGYLIVKGLIDEKSLRSPEIIFNISMQKVKSIISQLKDEGVETVFKEPVITQDMLRSNPHWSR